MFYLNAIVIEQLAKELHELFAGKIIDEIFSTSKTDWFLVAQGQALKISFFNQKPFFLQADVNHLPKKNKLAFNRNLESRTVLSVQNIPFERIIHFNLSSGFTLVLQMFGKSSDILLYVNDSLIKSFNYPNSTKYNSLASVSQSVVLQPSVINLSDKTDLKAIPFATSEIIEELKEKGRKEMPLNELVDITKTKMKGPYFLNLQGTPNIQITPNNTRVYNSLLNVMHDFSVKYIAYKSDQDAQHAHNRELEQALRNLDKKRISILRNIEVLQNKTSYMQIGDLLMANLHEVSKGLAKVELFNFYNNKPEIIALKPTLNAQQNAQLYYKKGKNEHLQLAQAEMQLSNIDEKIKQLCERKNTVDIPRVKQLEKTESSSFAHIIHVDGFEVWIGKNAKSNDEMIRRAHKEDLWLHARGYKGAHVLIRCQKIKKPLLQTIEKVASYAAFNSEGKHSQLVPVIYTLKKFVRKSKKMAIGQVMVDKEEVILVEPVKPPSK